jgi:hypothetical protein
MAALGYHCDTRRCREPIAVFALYRRRFEGRLTDYERFMCTAHGDAWAARHRLAIEDPPPGSERHRLDPDPGPGVRLRGMGAAQVREHEEKGWHCDRARCLRPVRYSASLRYRVRGEVRTRSWAGFLCVPHALSFARRHRIDFASVAVEGGEP